MMRVTSLRVETVGGRVLRVASSNVFAGVNGVRSARRYVVPPKLIPGCGSSYPLPMRFRSSARSYEDSVRAFE